MLAFLLAHWEMILAIIGNIIGWGKSFTKLLDWMFNKRKAYYERALKTCGYSTQYKFGTYFELKTRLHQIRDYIDGKFPIKGLVESFSSGYLAYTAEMKIDYHYFEDCANCLNKSWKLSRKLKRLNYLLLCNFSKDGIKNERHEIRNLAVECLRIIDDKISKYNLPENTENAI